MSDDLIELAFEATPKLIKVIGVGGGGGNAVGQMYRDQIPDVRYLVVNTDQKALADSVVPDRLQLGPGLGAGGVPERGRKLAEENVQKIREALDEETHMVFITAGMGGGTGTGASPIIAREARKKGILTVGIVTIPFLFERERQIDKALDGLDALAKEVDALLVINNQRLLEIFPEQSVIEAFKRADMTLSTAVSSITEIISMHGRVNLDFEDVRTVLSEGGVAVMSTGFAEGENRVTRAIDEALHSPLLNNNDVYSADRILIALTMSTEAGSELTMAEMNEMTAFMERFGADIRTKWGLAQDASLGAKVKVTILASGFRLYAKKTRSRQPEPEYQSTPEQDARRNRYYASTPHKTRTRPHVYLYSADDLDNPEVQERVDAVPTRLRTGAYLQELRSLAETLRDREEAPQSGTTDAAGPATIVFDNDHNP
ncbi:MAG: cell division protein FtsZ [Bacteroidales bacterium]|nr:cell division protein FtsZ [Bacteroidales bacterium]